ncbi:hypothetical protein [Onishia taeanensis]|uniref:hypothetical protein n=1 Tax=Onishia taeanensis TaxID=284577 RepID=UPI001113F412|nr:hypothetical protein [Halomonas taeanensis]
MFGNSRTEGNETIEIPRVGNKEPVCPHCSIALDKMPGRKKKCPSCSEFIFVRTCPEERVKVLVREDQIELIEKKWAIENGAHEQFLAENRDREAIKNQLMSQGIDSPTDLDVKWQQLKASLPKLASEYKWGLYRNARLGMGDVLKKQGKLSEALDTYLEVCFIDLNGPNNCGTKDPEILKMLPPFDPKSAFLAPGVLGYIEKMCKELNVKPEDLGSRFISLSSEVEHQLKLPISAEEAWKELSGELR